MHLKYIEIQGFKSFPDKTRLNFEQVLTGIVGPNGSGKSNISDAVLWVLGSQSSKSLRGSKMEDVIFGGTVLRRPMGFAQVSLCLDNKDGQVADVGEEIIVTRRYYRSGDSEYLINGSPVRLKDILEMFMDTGLGRDGYSIISQGRIGEVVDCKPEDRRKIFEEASGISKFRFRKNDAEDRLKQTQDNLERLHDIADELQSRLGPLKEQSEKAQKFLALSEERKGLEITLYTDSIDRAKENLLAQDEKIEIANLDLKTIEEKTEGCEKRIQALYERNRLSNAETEEFSQGITERSDRISALESQIAVLKNDIMHGEREIRSLQDERENLSSSGSGILAEIDRKKVEAETKKAQAAALAESIASLESELADLIAGSEKNDMRRTETAKRLNELQEQMTEIRVGSAAAQSVLDTLSEREQAIRNAVPEEKERLETCRKDLAETKEYIDRLEDEAGSKENSLRGFDMLLSGRIQKKNDLSAKLHEADLAIEKNRQRIQLLNDIEKNNDAYQPSVKRILEAKERRQLSGIVGTVGSLLEVRHGLETAIETALGAAVQNIVVEDERNAKDGIGFLKENRAGRATFLPLDTIRPGGFEFRDRLRDEGIVGLASELVTCDEKYRKVAQYLLGRVIVAEDLDYASMTARKANYRVRIVTKDGQVINAGGSYTGGYAARQAGVFSRRGEIDTLNREIEKITASTAEDRKKETQYENEIVKLQAQKTAVESELTASREDRIRAQAQSEKYENEISALEANLKTAEEELERIAENRLQKQTEIGRNEGRTKALQSDADRLERELSEAGSGDGFTERRASLMESISENRVESAELAKDIETLEASARALAEQGSDAVNRAANLEDAIAQARTENENRYAEVRSREKQVSGLKHEIEKLRSDMAGASELREQNEQAIREIRDEEKELNAQHENAASEISRLEERKASLQKEYDSNVSKLWEEYELSPAQAQSMKVPYSSITELRQSVVTVRNRIRALGNVNVASIEEYREVSERFTFLSAQMEDVEKSKKSLEDLISSLETEMKKLFTASFNAINESFHGTFEELFGGGKADLHLTDENDILGSGVELTIQPPGKVIRNLTSLSGGEKALAAIAIYMAMLKVNPSPFCILDEIDSALDDTNVVRFAKYLKRVTGETQIIAITHKRGTMEEADVLYGVTMQEEGVSKVLKLGIDEAQLVLEGGNNKAKG